MSVLGLASKRLQTVNIPEQVSLGGFLDISNRWISQQVAFNFPTIADAYDPTLYVECATLTGGNTNWNIAIPAGKNCFVEGILYARLNVSAFRVGCVGLRLYKAGVPVRSVGLISGFNVTDGISLRCSTILEADEADEVRLTCGYGGGSSTINAGGGSIPYYGGIWKLISS